MVVEEIPVVIVEIPVVIVDPSVFWKSQWLFGIPVDFVEILGQAAQLSALGKFQCAQPGALTWLCVSHTNPHKQDLIGIL